MSDAVKNFAKVVVDGGYTSANTTITLQTGEGTKLPQPSIDGEYNLVWWNYTDYQDPSGDPKKEIVRVTARTDDVLTVTRGQEGISATTKSESGKVYLMSLTVTKYNYDQKISDSETNASGYGFVVDEDDMVSNLATKLPTQQSVKAYVDTHASDISTHGVTEIVGKDENQTLTNKTLTTPTLTLANTTPTADGGIGFDRTNEDLVIGDGTNSQKIHMGAWKTWSPSWTNLTVGNGVQTATYCQVGKVVFYRLNLIFGTTTSITGSDFRFSLPIALVSVGTNTTILTDASPAANFVGINTSTNPCYPVVLMTGSTYASFTGLSSTSPITFTTNDTIYCAGWYESA